MLQATLLQTCLQSQANGSGSPRAKQNLHSFLKTKSNSIENYSCSGRLQGKEKESSPRYLREGKCSPISQKEQETKESLNKNFLRGSWRANEEELPFSNGLARAGRPVMRDSPKPASEMLPSGLSNRDEQSQEWKVVKVKRVLISPVGEPRKANISRSASLSENELKEAKARSQRIAAQLTTPPNTNSKGVLLFHRRKQRVNAFTLETPEATSKERAAREESPKAVPQHSILSHGEESYLKQGFGDDQELKGLSISKDSGLWSQKSVMEKYEENLAMDKTQRLPTMSMTSASAENSAEEFDQIPLSVYLKETTGTASTNGVHELTTNTFEKASVNEQIPVIDNIENMPSFADDISVTDRENNSTVLEKDPCILETDKENNILEKEPYVLDIGRENNNIPEKEPYVSLIDSENNIILDKALSEPVVDRKENGEVLSKEPDVLLLENMDISSSSDTEQPTQVKDVQPNETVAHTTSKHCCEVRLTLSKPNPVKNRSARPFGAQSLVTSHTPPPADGCPVVEFPPPPTYAESFSSPPPVTRVRSPPAYSALYPSEKQKVPAPQASLPQTPVVQAPVAQPSVPHAPVRQIPVPETAFPQAPVPQTKSERNRSGPLLGESTEMTQTKTGLLEESMARRSAKKSMFTFVEKPKVAPNPDLLNLVQRADNWKKQREQRGATPEEEPFALGAEASNFLPESRAKAGPSEAPSGDVPEWSSCLRSPRIQPRPRIQSNQSLPEAKGKGAELFAKRQSRMQKYTIEAPSQPDTTRSPSPTMSLPPSWKFASETHLSPMAFRPPPRSPARTPKTPPLPVYNSNMSESEISRKELEISKQQPYQLQPSMFISSPVNYPKAAPPPPKPVVSQPNYMRQASCPTSPWLPSAGFHPPVQPNPNISLPGLSPSPSGTMIIPQNIRTSIETSSEPTFEYSSRILSPRAKGIFQAPRPSYSTRNAGIEPQERKTSLPASPTWTPQQLRRQSSSLDGWVSPAPTPEPEEGLGDVFRAAAVLTPPPPMSPSWSERSLSPFRQEIDPKSSRQMQVLLARNIINAARRKSSSPKATGAETFRPFTPPATVATMSSSSGGSPKSVGNHLLSPLQSPRPMRMDGYRRVSLPTAIPQVSASSSNSPRLLGSQSPTYKSPLQSPKVVRMNGNKFFTLPANTGASLFSPEPTAHSVGHNRDQAQSPKHTAVGSSHRTFTPSGSTSKKPSCTSPKNMGIFSPTTKSPLQSPTMRVPSPVKRYTSMSPTNSDVSLDSEDSGIRSPSIRSFNICPRGWNGSLRLKRGSLPPEAPCTS